MNKPLRTLLLDLFYLLIGSYIVLVFLEKFKPGLVSNNIDLNKLLYFLVPLGVLCVLISNKKNRKKIDTPNKPPDIPPEFNISDKINK